MILPGQFLSVNIYRIAIVVIMSAEPVNLLKNYLRALSHSTVQPRKIPRPAITISRQSGAGALTVATLVAQELNIVCSGDPPRPWAVFSRNLVGKTLEDHSLAKRIEEFMPEDVRFPLTESFEFLLGLHPRSGVLREYAKETIRKLAMNGNVILVGRGAAVIAAGLPHVLHVRLIAPFHFRVRSFARSHGITEQEAVRMVRTNDVARRRYVRAYLNADITDALHYDLVINTRSKSLERVARIICAAVVHLVLQDRGQTVPARPAENDDAGLLHDLSLRPS
jgi:cytidylate kinase